MSLAAALEYLERGWSVIPIRPRDKRPLVKWAEFQRRRASDLEVRSWWERWPEANVGIVTGSISKIVVVDVDPRKGGRAAPIFKQFPTGLVARTGSGGVHLFYALPNGRRVQNAASESGVDWRGEGGYVVAPPSSHPSGGEYRWLRDREPGPPPEFVFQPAKPADSSREKEEGWLARVMHGVERGERNDACARLAGYWLSKRVPPEVILEQLMDWNKKNTPPMSAYEVERTLESVRGTHERRPRVQPEDVTLVDTKPAKPVSKEEQADEPFGVVGLGEYMRRFGNESVTWTIENWLPDKTVAMVVAPPGSYKTWLLLDLAVSIASGRPFLGEFAVNRQGPVLVIQQEDYHGQVAERLGVITQSRFDLEIPKLLQDGTLVVEPPPRLPVNFHIDRKFRFRDNAVLEGLIEKVAAIRPALVILDPLYSAGAVDDFMAGTATDMFLFKTLRDKFDTSFLIAHHTKKRADKAKMTTDREDLWGSQFLNAFIESGWQVRRRDEPNSVLIRRHFKVRADLPEGVLAFDIRTEAPFRYRPMFRVASADEAKGADIVAIVDERAPIGAADIAKLTGLDRSTVTRRLRKLLDARVIAQDSAGLYVPVESLT